MDNQTPAATPPDGTKPGLSQAPAGTSGLELLARRWCANGVAALLILTAGVTLAWPRPYQPLPAALRYKLTVPLSRLSVRCTAMTLRLLDHEVTTGGTELTVEFGNGNRYTFTGSVLAESVQRYMLPTWIMLLVGASVAAATWSAGPARRLVFVLLALVLPPALLPVFNGAFQGLAVASRLDRPEAIPLALSVATALAVFTTTVLLVAGLWIARSAVIELEPRAPAEGPALDVRPPLLWSAAALLCFWVLADIIATVVFLLRPPENREPFGKLGFHILALAAGAALTLLGLWKHRWAARLAWAPLLLLAAGGGGGLIGGLIFLVSAVAGSDERLDALYARPMTEPAKRRVLRRTLRPLTPVIWALVVIAVVAVLGQAAGLLILFSRLTQMLSRPAVVMPLAGVAAGLAIWELVGLRLAGRKDLSRPALAGLVISLVCLASSAVLGFALGLKGSGPRTRPAPARRDRAPIVQRDLPRVPNESLCPQAGSTRQDSPRRHG